MIREREKRRERERERERERNSQEIHFVLPVEFTE